MGYYDLDLLSNSKLSAVKAHRDSLPRFNVKKETLDFGSQLHEAVLEPEVYAKKLAIDIDYFGNKFKVQNMKQALMKNALLADMLRDKNVLVEHEHFFEENQYGVPCKLKADIVLRPIGADLKTTATKTLKDFEDSIMMYGYNRQAAFYMDALGLTSFIFFGIGKSYPHPTFTVHLPIDDPRIIEGRQEYEELITYYLEHKDEIVW